MKGSNVVLFIINLVNYVDFQKLNQPFIPEINPISHNVLHFSPSGLDLLILFVEFLHVCS